MKLADKKVIETVQSRIITRPEFNYDTMYSIPLINLLSQQDVDRLYNIATSVRYAGNAEKKFKAIDEIVHSRGFIKISAGTNRICYGHLEIPNICIKIAEDKTGIKDNPREFMNQLNLKPFCTKVFEVTPCGTVGLFERVRPIQSREEFLSVADQIFELIDVITCKYILADFGSKYFMNYGFRENFGPVILDFPYLYETDAANLICHKPITYSDGHKEICNGLIDYDDGFNNLICKKCGAIYRAVEISKYVNNKLLLIKGDGKMNSLRISVVKGDKTYRNYDLGMNTEQDHIGSEKRKAVGDKLIVSAKKVSLQNNVLNIPVQQSSKEEVVEKKEPVEQKQETVQNNPSNNMILKKTVTVNFNEDGSVASTGHSEKYVPKRYKKHNKNNNFKAKATRYNTNQQPTMKEKEETPNDSADQQLLNSKKENINFSDVTWAISSIDLEHNVVVYEGDNNYKVTVPIPAEMIENISAADELEIAKAEIETLKDQVILYKQGTEIANQNTEELADAKLELDDLKLKLSENNQNYQSLLNDFNELKDNYDQLLNNYDQMELQYKEASQKVKELTTTESVVVNELPVENSEDENTEDENTTLGITTINGTWCPISNLMGLSNIDIGDRDPEDRVIIFEDGEGGVFTDQSGNVVAVTSINGVELAKKQLQFTEVGKGGNS